MVLKNLDAQIPHKNINLNSDLTPFPKINSKWIIDQHVKHKATELEDKIEVNIGDLGFDK